MLEFRNAPLAQSGRIVSGYAAIFSSPAQIGDFFVERIAPGAFRKSLRTADVRALLDHDAGRVLGRQSAGGLSIAEDARGLHVEIDLPQTPDGDTALELIRRRILTGMSIGFRVRAESWLETDDLPVRTLIEVELFEVSVVAFPAYEDTTIQVARAAMNDSAAKRRILEKAKAAHRLRGI